MDDMRLKTKKVYDAVEGVLENNACHLHKPPASAVTDSGYERFASGESSGGLACD